MNASRRGYLIALILIGILITSRPSQAQYTSDYQTNIISGVTSNWTGDYYVGVRNANDALLIQNSGVLSDRSGGVGLYLWPSTRNNLVLVTGSGSAWSNEYEMDIGLGTSGNELIITNGGAVFDYVGDLGSDGGVNNIVVIAGDGAVWWNQGGLTVAGSFAGNGGPSGCSAVIGTGGSVIASNAYVNEWGFITVSGGALYVTNALGQGSLNLLYGNLMLNGGTITVDNLSITAGEKSALEFNGGVFNTKSTAINNGPPFIVGNGTNAATLNLAPGGTGFHFFANGLAISSNAMLKGIGTVIGATMINAGGVLAPGDGPGSIMFSNNLTLAAGSTLALTLDGAGAGQYSQIIDLGRITSNGVRTATISVSNCVLSLSLGYTPACGDSFTIISNLTSSAILGTFVTTDGMALPNGADFTVDNTIFQIDYGTFCNGFDVTLTALIPEPSSLLLTTLAAVSLFAVVRRKRT
jgi:T5SS/PEP-CTERM-associated repeat protein